MPNPPTTNNNQPTWNFWGEVVRAPSDDLTTLRAAMMEQNCFTSREKKNIPGLTLGMLQQWKAVEVALGWHNEIPKRMRECGTVNQHGSKTECRVPLCPRCMMLRRGRETAKNIKLFAHNGNEKLAFLTVLLPLERKLTETEDLKKQHKLKFRNAIKYLARKDPRWKQVYMKGYWEIDYYLDTELHELGRNKKIAMSALNPILTGAGKPVWHLHCHAIVHLGDITLQELKDAFRAEAYDLPYQVDIQPFKAYKSAEENLKTITRYSMKFRIETDFKRSGPFDPDYSLSLALSHDRNWWPKKVVAEFARFLCKPRGSFQSAMFWIGPDGESKNEVRSKTQKAKPAKKAHDTADGQDDSLALYMDDGSCVDLSEAEVDLGNTSSVTSDVGCVDVGMSDINKNMVYDTNSFSAFTARLRERIMSVRKITDRPSSPT